MEVGPCVEEVLHDVVPAHAFGVHGLDELDVLVGRHVDLSFPGRGGEARADDGGLVSGCGSGLGLRLGRELGRTWGLVLRLDLDMGLRILGAQGGESLGVVVGDEAF